MCVFILTSSIHADNVAKATRYQEVRSHFSELLKPTVARTQALLHQAN